MINKHLWSITDNNRQQVTATWRSAASNSMTQEDIKSKLSELSQCFHGNSMIQEDIKSKLSELSQCFHAGLLSYDSYHFRDDLPRTHTKTSS